MSKRHRRERQGSPDKGEGLWVNTEPDGRGGYVTTVSVDQDWSVRLDRDAATAYALVCVEAAQRAEYDAAIFGQMTRKLKLEHPVAAKVVVDDLRPDRPPLPDAAPGLRFEPGMNASGKPFMKILLDGADHGQLDPEALRRHALHVLETPVAADLDAGYRRLLVGTIGIDEGRAGAVIEDLANYR